MQIPASPVARKIVMAFTGQLMVLFVLFHALGNSTMFFGKINAYAETLHMLPVLIWIDRLALFIIVGVHILYGIILKLENRSAKPESYAVTNHLDTTFAGRNMIWTGAVIGGFLVWHLLQFTVQIIDPSTAAQTHADAAGRPDVFTMIARGLQDARIAGLYLVSVAALWLHLSHGIQSSVQTFGLTNEGAQPVIGKAGTAVATALFLLYAAIPTAIVIGLLK